MQSDITFTPVADCAVLAVCGTDIDEAVNARVMALDRAVRAAALPGVTETVPTYAALLVRYDPLLTEPDALTAALQALAADLRPGQTGPGSGRVVEIPVCYGGEYGPDLPFVAAHAGLSEGEVVSLHSQSSYLIYMMGFLPGFPYLGGLDERLHCPRLDTPRTRIPAGSVGIGGSQTGIYPVDSPGGWQLIGRTPLTLFDASRGGQLPYAAGDRIRFVPISPAEFTRLQKEGAP